MHHRLRRPLLSGLIALLLVSAAWASGLPFAWVHHGSFQRMFHTGAVLEDALSPPGERFHLHFADPEAPFPAMWTATAWPLARC